MCLSAVPWSASQITLAQRQSYNKTRPLNHISTAFYRPTPQLRHYETVYHTEMCVPVCAVCVCVCEAEIVCEREETVWEETRVCFTKRCWRLSCSPRHLTAFHLLLLLDQPRAAVTSPFRVLTSHEHTHTLTYTPLGDHWLRSSSRTFWLVNWSLLRQAREGEGNQDVVPAQSSVNMQTGGLNLKVCVMAS